MPDQVIIPGDDEKPSEDSDPTIVLQETVREITDTTLGDKHAPSRVLRRQVAEGMEDWGDGFFVNPVPVHILRGPDGEILRTTPLNEIPGVSWESGKLKKEVLEPLEVAPKPTPVPMQRADREKLVTILAHRLFKYYLGRLPNDTRWNPLIKGLPIDLIPGSSEYLAPKLATICVPATNAEVYDYLVKVIVERVTVINTHKYGGNTIQDIALRIE